MYRLKIWLVISLFALSIPAQVLASVGVDSEIPSTELSPAYASTGLNDPAEYVYDHTGQRIKQDLDSGGDVTIYPNKYYNVDTQGETSKVTEQVYDNKGSLVLTAENDGTNLTLHYDHTDHLGGSSVMTDTDGVVEQIIDYYPFGSMRFNQKETAFDEQRKFTPIGKPPALAGAT